MTLWLAVEMEVYSREHGKDHRGEREEGVAQTDKSKGEQVMLHLDCIGIEVKSQRYEGRGVQVSPDEQEAVLIMEKRTGKRFFTFYSGKRSSE